MARNYNQPLTRAVERRSGLDFMSPLRTLRDSLTLHFASPRWNRTIDLEPHPLTLRLPGGTPRRQPDPQQRLPDLQRLPLGAVGGNRADNAPLPPPSPFSKPTNLFRRLALGGLGGSNLRNEIEDPHRRNSVATSTTDLMEKPSLSAFGEEEVDPPQLPAMRGPPMKQIPSRSVPGGRSALGREYGPIADQENLTPAVDPALPTSLAPLTAPKQPLYPTVEVDDDPTPMPGRLQGRPAPPLAAVPRDPPPRMFSWKRQPPRPSPVPESDSATTPSISSRGLSSSPDPAIRVNSVMDGPSMHTRAAARRLTLEAEAQARFEEEEARRPMSGPDPAVVLRAHDEAFRARRRMEWARARDYVRSHVITAGRLVVLSLRMVAAFCFLLLLVAVDIALVQPATIMGGWISKFARVGKWTSAVAVGAAAMAFLANYHPIQITTWPVPSLSGMHSPMSSPGANSKKSSLAYGVRQDAKLRPAVEARVGNLISSVQRLSSQMDDALARLAAYEARQKKEGAAADSDLLDDFSEISSSITDLYLKQS